MTALALHSHLATDLLSFLESLDDPRALDLLKRIDSEGQEDILVFIKDHAGSFISLHTDFPVQLFILDSDLESQSDAPYLDLEDDSYHLYSIPCYTLEDGYDPSLCDFLYGQILALEESQTTDSSSSI